MNQTEIHSQSPRCFNISILYHLVNLDSGFNPFEKYARKIGSFPPTNKHDMGET